MQLILAGPVGGADEHVGGPHHPERPARIDAVMAGIADLQLGRRLVTLPPEPAKLDDLARVHSRVHLQNLEEHSRRGGGDIDADTFAGTGSWAAARSAAGAGLAAVRALQQRGDGVGFVVARPPGHHAEPQRAMGFCLLNNVAVAAAALADAGQRVLIVDWDVHHGNGTQAVFWDDPRVLFVSTHQWPLYPGTGRAEEVGGAAALDLTINIPLPAGATGDVIRHALEVMAGPTVERFAPDWVLVSCGFDAHRDDPLGGLALSSGDFARLATEVAGYAPAPGRLVLFLEGGYDLAALRSSASAAIGVLLGAPATWAPETVNGPGREEVSAAHANRVRAVDRAGGPAPL